MGVDRPMNGEFLEALEQLQKEKDIPMTALVQTVEAAMSSAYRKHYVPKNHSFCLLLFFL